MPEDTFTNELGNRIYMKVEKPTDTTVRVVAEGPTSVCDHTWTVEEARHLRQLLEDVFALDVPQKE